MRQSAAYHTTRAMATAITSGAVVATGMMFVPVGVLEGLIALTGLPKLVPAVSAPLGDVARAMIAYMTGGVTLGGFTVLLLRDGDREDDLQQSREMPFKTLEQYRVKILNFLSTKMSWHKEEEEVRSLSDLSRFRPVDGDAPIRRPLVASQDLPASGWVGQPTVVIAAPPEPALESEYGASQIIEPTSVFTLPPTYEAVSLAAPKMSTADLVAQLETAAAVRHQQRTQLKANGTDGFAQVPDANARKATAVYIHDGICNEGRRPLLELVSSAVVKDDDADSALAAALATLHRMTAIAR